MVDNKNYLDLHEQLIDSGIYNIYQYNNYRSKYKKDKFIIDFDHAIFPDGYESKVCEIELIVGDEHQIEEALHKISYFAAIYGMQVENVKARLIEYIERINHNHYILLQEINLKRTSKML